MPPKELIFIMNQLYAQNKIQVLLEEKLSALKQYQAITNDMDTATAVSDFRRLRGLMFDRHKYMRKIQSVDKSIAAILPSDKSPFASNDYKSNRLVDRYRQDYLQIMETVVPTDRKICCFVADAGEKLKNELLAMKKNRQAVSKYGTPVKNVSRYLDTKN